MRKIRGMWAGFLLGSVLAAPGNVFENGLALEILPSWPIELALMWPSNFTHAVDVYFCEDLRTAEWEFFVAGEETEGLEALWITDLDSTNRTMGFYRPGDATLDSDGDGLPDDRERFIYKTDPERFDTDGDGMPDGWEVAHGLDPLTDDAGEDPDGDGLSNLDEYIAGTDPNVAGQSVSWDVFHVIFYQPIGF